MHKNHLWEQVIIVLHKKFILIMHMPVHWLILIEIWIQIWGFRYKMHSKVKVVLFLMPREVICGSKINCFSLTANYIGKHSDFLAYWRLCFVPFFTLFSLVHVLITQQKLGFDRHSYFPLFANSNTSQIMRKSNNEKI